MLASRRWRDWRSASTKNIPEAELTQLTKPLLSVLSVPSRAAFEMPSESRGISSRDLAACRLRFAEWLNSACLHHWRVSGNMVVLYQAFCNREITRQGIPCNRETFEMLLRERGVTISEFFGTRLANGVALWPDAERLRELGLLQ